MVGWVLVAHSPSSNAAHICIAWDRSRCRPLSKVRQYLPGALAKTKTFFFQQCIRVRVPCFHEVYLTSWYIYIYIAGSCLTAQLSSKKLLQGHLRVACCKRPSLLTSLVPSETQDFIRCFEKVKKKSKTVGVPPFLPGETNPWVKSSCIPRNRKRRLGPPTGWFFVFSATLMEKRLDWKFRWCRKSWRDIV